MIQRNGNISHALGLEELMLLKWPYYSKQSTDLMQPLSNYPWHFSHNYNKQSHNLYGSSKDPDHQSNPEVKEESLSQNSDNTVKLHQSSTVLAKKKKKKKNLKNLKFEKTTIYMDQWDIIGSTEINSHILIN